VQDSQVADVQDSPVVEARHRIAVAAGAALLVAGIVLVLFVLPAEFAVDPLGTGARFGLLDLGIIGQQVEALESSGAAASAGEAAILAPQDRPFQHETIELTVGPRQWVEYKYRLEKGEALLYSWKTSGPVNLDFHAEPDGGPRGYAQSYETKQAVTEASGTMTAPFSGIHGWYWENTTDQDITVTLTSSGYYNIAHEFRDGQPPKNKMFQ
jgi:hypothetical protein